MSAISLPGFGVEVPASGLSIGDVSRITGLSSDTLRYYEREGLMLDETARDVGGRRRYGADDLAWISGLLMLRDTGMSVADMRALARLSREEGTEAERLVVLDAHRERVLDELAQTQRHLTALEAKIASYRQVVGAAHSDEERTRT